MQNFVIWWWFFALLQLSRYLVVVTEFKYTYTTKKHLALFCQGLLIAICNLVFFHIIWQMFLKMSSLSWVAVSLESWFDGFVSFESRNEAIKDPEKDKDRCRSNFDRSRAAKFSTRNWRIAPEHQNGNGQKGFYTENGHRESQAENSFKKKKSEILVFQTYT